MRTTFRHTHTVFVSRPIGFDFMGQATYSRPKRARVTVIYFQAGQGRSSIRADRSESKARAEEQSGKVRLLVHPDDAVRLGDKVMMFNEVLRVTNVFPRHDLNGHLHHVQVDLELWVEIDK